MSKALAALIRALPQLLIALALLALACSLGVRHTLTGAESYAVVLAVLGGGSVSAGLVLGSPLVDNSNTLPHLFVLMAALAVTAVLASYNVIRDADVFGVLALAVGATTLGAGTATQTTTPAVPPPTAAEALAAAQAAVAREAAAAQAPPPAVTTSAA